MKIVLRAFAGAIALATVLLFAASAHALKIQPAIIDLSLNPGESSMQSVRLINNSTTSLEVEMVYYDAEGSSNEEGYAQYTKRNADSTLANWIKPSGGLERFSLTPNEARAFSFSILVPENAPIGGHYAGLGFTVHGQTPTVDESVVSLSGGPIVNIAIDVPGETLEKGDIVSFATANGKTNYDKLPVGFVTRINNGGNRHFKPRGSIEIKNMFGSVVASLPLNETNGGGNVLPRSTREFKNEWVGEFAFGKYTAVLTANLAGAGTKTANLELWVMPAGLIVLWLIIALIIIVILVLLIKKALQSSAAVKK